MNATLQRLQDHPLADAIRDLPALRLFMEHHVFAVWDFQVLLRALERQLTSAGQADLQAVPAAAVEFLQRIVAEEERDLAPANPSGASHLSHLEIYLLAMEEVGASTETIKALLARVGHGRTHGFQAKALEKALKGLPIPEPSRRFMAFTFEVMASDEAPLMAAAFAHGRELLVPRLFEALLERALIPKETGPSSALVHHHATSASMGKITVRSPAGSWLTCAAIPSLSNRPLQPSPSVPSRLG